MESKNKTWLWAAAVVLAVAALAGWMWWSPRQATAPGASETAAPQSGVSADDTTSAIDAELNATDFGNLEAELQATDADLNSL